MTRVAIVGFGLIGASIALALREKRGACGVTAIDRAEVLASEAARAIADERVDAADLEAKRKALAGSEICVLAAPVSVVAESVVLALEHAPVVTDCGSTKRGVLEAARASANLAHFVPGHPLAGGSQGGAENARSDLFRGRRWVLCPELASEAALAVVEALVGDLGAVVVRMRADEHDRAVALTSHVPQLLSSALVVLSRDRGAERLEGPGFERMTQGAGASPEVWRDIFRTNADEIAQALRELGHELELLAAELGESPPRVERALDLLAQARRARTR